MFILMHLQQLLIKQRIYLVCNLGNTFFFLNERELNYHFYIITLVNSSQSCEYCLQNYCYEENKMYCLFHVTFENSQLLEKQHHFKLLWKSSSPLKMYLSSCGCSFGYFYCSDEGEYYFINLYWHLLGLICVLGDSIGHTCLCCQVIPNIQKKCDQIEIRVASCVTLCYLIWQQEDALAQQAFEEARRRTREFEDRDRSHREEMEVRVSQLLSVTGQYFPKTLDCFHLFVCLYDIVYFLFAV